MKSSNSSNSSNSSKSSKSSKEQKDIAPKKQKDIAPKKQKDIAKESYHRNKARVARRRILLAIASGKCVLEKTLIDRDGFYNWSPGEKKVLQTCIDKRRDSYLTLHQVEQIADKRYIRRMDIPNGRVNRYEILHGTNDSTRTGDSFEAAPHPARRRTPTNQTRAVETNTERTLEPDIQTTPIDGLGDLRLLDVTEQTDTIEEYKERTRKGKSVKRPDVISIDEPNLKWKNVNSNEKISVELFANLYDSLYADGHRKRKNNDRQKKINYRIYTRLFELMEIDNLMVVYEQPNMALDFIHANSKYLSMTPFVHVIVSFLFHLEKGNFDSYISKNLDVCWLYRLTHESMKHNEEEKICELVANDNDPIIDQTAISSLRNDLKERQTFDMEATTHRLASEPYFDWQSICRIPELINDKNWTNSKNSMKTATYRVLLALYTREFVARDDYGGLLVYTLPGNFLVKRNVFEQHKFLVKKARNVIIRVQDVHLESARRIYFTIDDNEFLKYSPDRYVYKPTYYQQSEKMKRNEFRYILYMLDHKTYEGFKLDPVILTEITSDYIDQLLEFRTKGNVKKIPFLPLQSSNVSPIDMFLFVKEHDKQPYAEPWKLGPLITRMFGELTGTHISINDLRHSYASYLRTTDGGRENKVTIIRASNRMFHTPKTHVAFYTHTSKIIYLYRQTANTKVLNTFVKENKLESERVQNGPPYGSHRKTSADFHKNKTIAIHYLKASDGTVLTNKKATIINVSESEYVEGDSSATGKIITTQVDATGEPIQRILQKIKIKIEGHHSDEFITNSTIYTKPNEKVKFFHLTNQIIDINTNGFPSKQSSNDKCRKSLNTLLKKSKSVIDTLKKIKTLMINGSYDESSMCVKDLSNKGKLLFRIEIERLIRTFSEKNKHTDKNNLSRTFYPVDLRQVRLLLNDYCNENGSYQFALVPTDMLKKIDEAADGTFYPTLKDSLLMQTNHDCRIRFATYNDLLHLQLQTKEVMTATKIKRKDNRCDYIHYEPVLYKGVYKNVISNFKNKNGKAKPRFLDKIYPLDQNSIRKEIGLTGKQYKDVYDFQTGIKYSHLSFFESVKKFVNNQHNGDDESINNEIRTLPAHELKSGLLKSVEQQQKKQKNKNETNYEKSIRVLNRTDKCTSSISGSEIVFFCKHFDVSIKVWGEKDKKWIEYNVSREPMFTILLTCKVIKV